MNLKKLESRFKDIEDREKKLNSFFNPYDSKGPKHYCIKDLHKDFEYDTQLYGLGRFYQLPSNTHQSNPSSSQLSIKPKSPSKSPKKPSTNPDFLHLSRQTDSHNSDIRKKEYQGAFSSTKIQPRVASLTSEQVLRSTPEWTASQINERVTNKSALEKVRFGNSEHSPINLFKKTVRDRFQLHPKEWTVEREYKEKPVKRFVMEDEKKDEEKNEKAKVEFKSRWFDIRYADYPLWVAAEKGIVTFTLVDSEPKSCRFRTKANEQFFLPEIEWLRVWKEKILRIQEQFGKFSEYFWYFGEKFEGSDQVIEEKIDFYFSLLTPNFPKKSSISPVMPIDLKKISHKSPNRSRSSIKLPVLKEKLPDTQLDPYANPLTQRLVKYRQSSNNFNPTSFPANLTIFEMHDLMESRYRKTQKDQASPLPKPIGLGVQGRSLQV